MSLRAGLRKGTKSSADGVAAFLRDSLGKTGRRLTSDPIRTSLGLLPSGPDPVGEWLVHRQSPGPYLGPKRPESKRAHDRSNPAQGGPFQRPRTVDFDGVRKRNWIICFRRVWRLAMK